MPSRAACRVVSAGANAAELGALAAPHPAFIPVPSAGWTVVAVALVLAALSLRCIQAAIR